MKTWNITIPLPPFSGKACIYAVLLLCLPNLFFGILTWFLSAARPLFNLDYVLPMLLLVATWRTVRLFGVLTYWLAVIFDCLMLIMQLFPFMDLAGVIYLAPFVVNAPLHYQGVLVLLVVYGAAMPYLLRRYVAVRTNIPHVLGVAALLLPVAYFTGHIQYHERHVQDIVFGRNNFYLFKSQSSLYFSNQNLEFLQGGFNQPTLSKLKYQRAADLLEKYADDKVLLVLVESWSEPKNHKWLDTALQSLSQLHQNGRLRNWENGYFAFNGATVEGEMRELCALAINGGYALQNIDDVHFSNCLPRQFAQKGHHTVAMHAASGTLYDRFNWYPKAGFKQVYFPESPELIRLPRCSSFAGVCDSALFDVVGHTFDQHPKLFFYWMTLTSHAPYPKADIVLPSRFDCAAHNLPEQTMLCRNYQMHTQFFDRLAQLLQKPQMKGTRVILVADHSSPTQDLGEAFKYLNGNHIPWVSFVVAE